MKNYTTFQSAHCFYGNISNILNYHNIGISEAEFALISNILNGEYRNIDMVPFIGFSNEKYKIGLSKLGCRAENIRDEICFFEMLKKRYPILLKVNSQVLNYNYVYKESSKRNHYIVAIQCDSKDILISDSYIPTLPLSTYQGTINRNDFCIQFENNQVSGIVIFPPESNKFEKSNCDLIKQLDEYVLLNISGCDNSFCKLMYEYCEYALQNITDILFSNRMDEMIYQMRFSGTIARWNYLIELFCTYYQINKLMVDELNVLKGKWNVVINKLRKCSITRNPDYYKNIFVIDIPKLLEKELIFYKTIVNLRGNKNDRTNR